MLAGKVTPVLTLLGNELQQKDLLLCVLPLVRWGKGGRCLGLTTLPSSCAVFVEIPGVSTHRGPKVLHKSVTG